MGDIRSRFDVSIWDEEQARYAQVNTNNRLKVDASVSSSGPGSNFANWAPKFTHSKTDVAIGTSDTTIATITDAGVINYLMLNLETDTMEVILIADGTEFLRITTLDLKSATEYYLDLTAPHPIAPSIGTGRAGKTFVWKPTFPAYFSTSFTVKAKNAVVGKDCFAHLIEWREEP